MAHVFDDQVKTIALATRFGFGLLELAEVSSQFLVGLTQISYVTKDRNKPERLAT